MNSFANVLMFYHSLWARVILCAHYNIHHRAKQQKLVSHLQGLDNYLTLVILSNKCGNALIIAFHTIGTELEFYPRPEILLAEYMIRRLSIVI